MGTILGKYLFLGPPKNTIRNWKCLPGWPSRKSGHTKEFRIKIHTVSGEITVHLYVQPLRRGREDGISSADGKYRCMNTGLLTVYNQEIVAIFAVNEMSGKQPWFFNGFFKETGKVFYNELFELPPLADYCNNVKDLIYK